jgi:glycosyltransferase involved in cell wall biosynthesis
MDQLRSCFSVSRRPRNDLSCSGSFSVTDECGANSRWGGPSADQLRRLDACRVIGFAGGLELFGHQRSQLEIFKALRDLGATVHVVVDAIDHGGAVGAESRRLGFPTSEFPFGCQWSKTFFKKQPSLVLKCLASVVACSNQFRRLVNDFRPTHAHIGNSLVYSYVAPALSIIRLPLIFRVGDAVATESWPNYLLWKSGVRRAAHVVTISKFLHDSVAAHVRIPPERVSTIYNLSPIRPAYCSREVRNPLRVVYVGQISAHKGVEQLVDATKEILRRHPDVYFDLVGGSRYTHEFEKNLQLHAEELGVADRVLFHGQVSDPTPFYRSAFVHVVPSVQDEACGNVVMEAKYMCVPSIVFPSGALPELVHHKVDGYVCQDKSVDSLIDAINWFLDEPSRCEAAGVAAHEDYETRFGTERFANQWAEIYRDTLRNNS